jgi:hypothetical protein
MYFEVLQRPEDSPYAEGSVLSLAQVAPMHSRDVITFERESRGAAHLVLLDLGYAFKILDSPMEAGTRDQDDVEFLNELEDE